MSSRNNVRVLPLRDFRHLSDADLRKLAWEANLSNDLETLRAIQTFRFAPLPVGTEPTI